VVKSARRRDPTREKVAVKIIPKKKTAGDQASSENQLEFLKMVNHPNVVRMIEIHEDREKFTLVFELMSGYSLVNLLSQKSLPLPEQQAYAMIIPVFDAVLYCHELGIIHGNIKPENLLLSEDQTIKVSNFGMSRFVDGNDYMTNTSGNTLKDRFRAPEVFCKNYANEGQHEEKCDFWSLGCILFYMLCGTPPFISEDLFILYDQIKSGKYDFTHPNWSFVSQEGQDFLAALLVLDPAKRLGGEDILSNPWFKGEF
jgi:serine/threonine protein kinase